MRSAMEFLAYSLVGNGLGRPLTDKEAVPVGFPIADNSTKYPTLRDGKIKGASPDAFDAVDAIEPYNGGKGHALWILHKLNNIDKHRLLVAVVSMAAKVDQGWIVRDFIRKDVARMARESGRRTPEFEFKTTFPRSWIPISSTRPAKIGDELATVPIEMNEDMQFAFTVAFNEPGIIECQPVVPLLHQTADLIDSIILEFAPLLK